MIPPRRLARYAGAARRLARLTTIFLPKRWSISIKAACGRLRALPERNPWLAWGVLAAGLLAGAATFLAAEHKSEAIARSEFTADAEAIGDQIESRFRAYGDVLHALRGLFASSHHVDAGEFARFVDGMAVHERYPGLLNVSYAQWVPHARKVEFERRVQFDFGDPKFRIHPPGDRSSYHVLLYFAPQLQAQTSFGLDLGVDPARRAVVEKARDSAEVASSGPVALMRHGDRKPASILLRLALYRDGIAGYDLEERRERYVGVVGAALDPQQMLQAVLPKSRMAQVRLVVHDGGAAAIMDESASPDTAGVLLFDSDRLLEAQARDARGERWSRYAADRQLRVGDRVWMLRVLPRTDPQPWASRMLPYLLSAIVVMLALLLFGLVRALALAESRATRDKLTGLYNRHYMHEWFELELHRARRHARPLGVILCDVDHFKRINDSFGHDGGDQVLRAAGALLRSLARQSDVVCRYGGEEFVILMPEASLAAAEQRAEALLHAFRALRIQHRGRALGRLTLSAGVAAFPDHGAQPDALLTSADRALYRAKQDGRDRVAVARAPRPTPRAGVTEVVALAG